MPGWVSLDASCGRFTKAHGARAARIRLMRVRYLVSSEWVSFGLDPRVALEQLWMVVFEPDEDRCSQFTSEVAQFGRLLG